MEVKIKYRVYVGGKNHGRDPENRMEGSSAGGCIQTDRYICLITLGFHPERLFTGLYS